MGFTRVGCVQSKSPCPDEYVTGPVEEYITQKNGETCQQIAKKFGVDVWDIIFLNQPLYGSVLQHQSWLKEGTKIFVPKKTEKDLESKLVPKWYVSKENDTPRGISRKFKVNFGELLQANKRRYPELTGNSRLMEGTRIQIANFHIDEADMTGYSHWTFPDTNPEEEEPSYMMALKLDRKKGRVALEKPVAASLSVRMNPYLPDQAGVDELLLRHDTPIAPVFSQTKKLQPPKKPKRPTTSFGHFSSEIRSNLPNELKGKVFGAINSYIAEQWRLLTDEDKVPYIEKFEESKAAFADAMRKYELELANFKREVPLDTTGLLGQDTFLLEKVVKLKSNCGISGASKYDYYYVLTFIPDLQWVHLIPMIKAGEFDNKHPEICGRPIWKLVGEDTGKEIDTTASVCEAVTARTMNNSANADDEHWDIYDRGEIPPVLAALIPKTAADAPVKPKKPATSFALFCADARSSMSVELKNKTFTKCTQILAYKWKQMTVSEKAKYKKQHLELNTQYLKEMRAYEDSLASFVRENPNVVIEERKRGRPRKYPLPIPSPQSISPSSPDSSVDQPVKKKRGRPRKNPLQLDVPLPEKKKAKTERITSGPKLMPSQNDVVLSLVDEYYKEIMWKHFRLLGTIRAKDDEDAAIGTILSIFKQRVGRNGKFYKRDQKTGKYSAVTQADARASELYFSLFSISNHMVSTIADKLTFISSLNAEVMHDVRRRVSTSQSWADTTPNKAIKTRSPKTSQSRQKPTPLVSRPPPAFTTKTNSNDVILSLLNEKYKATMWIQFRKLGRTNGSFDRENVAGMDVLFKLKRGMGTRGRYFKKAPHSLDLTECSEDQALDKIRSDLKRRMSSRHHWLGEDQREKDTAAHAINRYPIRVSGSIPSEVKEAAALFSPKKPHPSSKKSKPKLYASPYIKRNYGVDIPSEPAAGFPDGWVTRQIPRAKKTDKRLDRYWYSPMLGLAFRNRDDAHRFAKEVERAGGDESKVLVPTIQAIDADKKDQSPVSHDEKETVPNASNRPLAPIFLKNYGKKRKKLADAAPEPHVDSSSEVVPSRSSRYPDRKRKCSSSADIAAVSDGADSVSSVELVDEPRRKKSRK